MSLFWSLFESLLKEEVALTKGSQRVMNDKKMVKDLADAIRDDVAVNSRVFPQDIAKGANKMSDQQLAHWFLSSLDEIEKAGYEDTVYSREGVNNEWIARRYIAGSHTWEDLIGVMNMNLRDWYLLKNRNLLGSGHTDIPKYKSVRDIGAYINTHYEQHLKDVRDAAKTAALKKSAKTAKLIDNEDYKIYTVLNRNGSIAIGLGSQWCTANTESGVNYENYSSRAMLFQLFPTEGEKDVKGRIEKYQFDAAGPTFNDVLDHPVNREMVKERWPYLYVDLVKSLKDNKEQLETAMKELSENPTLQSKDTKVKVYNIDDEIKKLKKFIDMGYFTDKKRPVKKPEEPETQGEQPAEQPKEVEPPSQGEVAMEGIDKDVADMLNNLKKLDKLTESRSLAKRISEKKKAEEGCKMEEKKKEVEEAKWHNQDRPQDHFKGGLEKAVDKVKSTFKGKKEEPKKVEEEADPEVIAWMERFSRLGR